MIRALRFKSGNGGELRDAETDEPIEMLEKDGWILLGIHPRPDDTFTVILRFRPNGDRPLSSV